MIEKDVKIGVHHAVNRFMYDHNLHDGRKYSCWFCLQSFSTKEILKLHIKDFFEIIGK